MNQSQRSYGIGQDPTTREYNVYIDGVRVASYPFLRSALAHIDAHRDPFVRWDEGKIACETLDTFRRERAQGGRSC